MESCGVDGGGVEAKRSVWGENRSLLLLLLISLFLLWFLSIISILSYEVSNRYLPTLHAGLHRGKGVWQAGVRSSQGVGRFGLELADKDDFADWSASHQLIIVCNHWALKCITVILATWLGVYCITWPTLFTRRVPLYSFAFFSYRVCLQASTCILCVVFLIGLDFQWEFIKYTYEFMCLRVCVCVWSEREGNRYDLH